jgi:hypothetical protein
MRRWCGATFRGLENLLASALALVLGFSLVGLILVVGFPIVALASFFTTRLRRQSMLEPRQLLQTTVLCAATIMLLRGSVQAIDLNGVWASDKEVCDKVFNIKGGKISFARNADIHGSGFIIEGQRVRGRTVTCKVLRTKTEQELVHMVASCATDVMLSNVQLSVRVLEQDKVNRVFPGLEDMEMPFYRCPVPKR